MFSRWVPLLILGAALVALALWLKPNPEQGDLIIFAAASLKEPFTELGQLFEKQTRCHPVLNLGGTNQLRVQIEEGAAGDLFASASVPEMEKAKKAGTVAEPSIFARNRLILVAPQANTAKLKDLLDLARPGVKLVTAHPDVPIGTYTRNLLKRLAAEPKFGSAYTETVEKNIRSLETNVKQVLAKVLLGEADAGFIYQSDVLPTMTGQLVEIPIPPALNVPAEYPIARLKNAVHPRQAQQFLDLLLSPEGQAIMKKWNFVPARP
jgi:molybdate transport system substrate-binding protein